MLHDCPVRSGKNQQAHALKIHFLVQLEDLHPDCLVGVNLNQPREMSLPTEWPVQRKKKLLTLTQLLKHDVAFIVHQHLKVHVDAKCPCGCQSFTVILHCVFNCDICIDHITRLTYIFGQVMVGAHSWITWNNVLAVENLGICLARFAFVFSNFDSNFPSCVWVSWGIRGASCSCCISSKWGMLGSKINCIVW